MRQEDAEELQKKILSAKFNFNDFLKQTQMIAQMGSFGRLIGMIPGMNKVQIWISCWNYIFLNNIKRLYCSCNLWLLRYPFPHF